MKKITCLLIFFVAVLGYSQSLPLDFEVPEDDAWGAFNGTVATVVTDPTDASNTVLEMIGAGVDFDGAALSLDTYVDLSDDANNTVSIRIWAPDATVRTHLLKFEGGSSGATELTFTTSMMGWQTVNVDFGSGLGTEYPVIVLFTDSTPGNTATGTYYIDDITGPNGAMIPNTPMPSGPAANPTSPVNEVLSIYSDTSGYTNLWVADYAFGTVNTVDLGTASVNENLQFNLATAGWGQGTNVVTDISTYNYLQFDYWADANSTEIRFFLIDNAGSVVEYWYEIGGAAPQEPIVNEAWTHVEIPLSFFETAAPNNQAGTGGFTKQNFFQWKLDASSNLQSEFIYIDNIYFSQNMLSTVPTAPTDNPPTPPARNASDVVSIYSDAYTNLAVANFDPNWGQSGHTLVNTAFDPGTGDVILHYPNFNYQGTDFGSSVDLSTMEFVHIDVWTANATNLQFSPINNGTGVGEILVDVPLVTGQWSSVDLPITAFTGMTWDSVFQLKFDGQAGATPSDIWLENIYFYKGTPLSNSDVTTNVFNVYPNPTSNSWNIVSPDVAISEVQVFDLTGKLIMVNEVNSSSATIDATSLSNGIYLARIISDNAVETIKIVKE